MLFVWRETIVCYFYGIIKTVMYMSEKKLERFIWTAVLLACLLLLAAFHTEFFMGCLLCGAALIVVFLLKSLSDEQRKSSLVVQGLFSLLFSLLAGHFMAYLIFYELRFIGKKNAKTDETKEGNTISTEKRQNGLCVILPGLFYFLGILGMRFIAEMQKAGTGRDGAAIGMIENCGITDTLPLLLWKVLLLTACAGVFFVIESVVAKYLRIQRESAAAVRGAAINELYEKKLNQELRMKNYLAERNARLEERENISRNIHNSVGHTITAAVMTLDAAELLLDVDTGKAKERVVTAKERMKEGLGAIRCAVRVLDKEAQAIRMDDFLSELAAVADNFVMDTELEVKTDIDLPPGVPDIPSVHTEFLTGAVQELLTNGVKHGKANRFLLSVTADSAHLQVSVKDNGTGDFSEANKEVKLKEGFGLKKIVAYLKKCGGSASFTNENGFCAVLVVPLLREETDGEV